MGFQHFLRVVVSVAMMILVSACSGSSSSPSSSVPFVPATDNNPPTTPPTTSSARALLPVSSEPNAVGLQLAKSADGTVHAAYADISGRIFYAQCANNCGQSTAWQAVEIDNVDVGFSGYAVPRLELDTRSRPRIAFHVVPGSFERGNTHFAQCDRNCLSAENWQSAAVLGHGENVLKFYLTDTDWFALDPTGGPVIALLLKNGQLDTEGRLRILHCQSNCIANAGWDQRIIASYSFTLGRPAHIEISAGGQYHLALLVEGIGSDTSDLTWFGCSINCLTNGDWGDGIALQTVESDLNSIPHASLSITADGNPALLSFDNKDSASLTLHQCVGTCSQPSNWVSLNVSERIDILGGVYDVGHGVDLRANGDALEMVFAGKPEGSPIRQMIISSRCENQCTSAGSIWTTRLLARTDEQLPDEGVCTFLGTTITSGLSFVPGVVGFTASPQWACGLSPVVVTRPDGESYIDNSSDIRFLELASVVAYQ